MDKLLMVFGLLLEFIKRNLSNLCLFSAILLVLRYVLVVYSFDVMTLGVAVVLLIVSITSSLNDSKKDKNSNQNRYY